MIFIATQRVLFCMGNVMLLWMIVMQLILMQVILTRRILMQRILVQRILMQRILVQRILMQRMLYRVSYSRNISSLRNIKYSESRGSRPSLIRS